MANGDSAKTDDGAAAKGAEPKKEPEASKWGDDEEEETAPLKSENGSAGAPPQRPRRTRPPPPPPVERTPSDKTKSPRDKGGRASAARAAARTPRATAAGRPGPRARAGARADDGKLLSEQPGSANRRTRGTGTGERHAGTVVYICASYGFIRMDTSDGAKEEDVFMHLVDVDFAPTIKERVTFELARFRERNKAVEVRQCEPGAKRSPPAKAKASVEDPAKEWPKAERLARAADLVAWLEGGAPPGALEAPGELLLASDDVARFFDAHAGHAAAATGRKELAAGDLPLFSGVPQQRGRGPRRACGASAGALEYVGGDVVCRLKAGTYAKPPPAPPAAPPRRRAADDGKAERKPREPRERKPPREPRTGPAADKFIVRRLRTMFLGGLRWDEGKGPATDASSATASAASSARATARGSSASTSSATASSPTPSAPPAMMPDRPPPRAPKRAPAGDKGPRRAKGDRPGTPRARRRRQARRQARGRRRRVETKPGGAADAAAAAAPAADAAPQTTKA
ncbi:phytanoyl-CoA dioxygenase [Aureococcus anophagefferens]|nr:phytanoyl-CoA dioxygenase [Aureococcus anophagefferens]